MSVDLDALVNGPNLLEGYSDEIPRSRRKRERVSIAKPPRKRRRQEVVEEAPKRKKKPDINMLVQKAILERLRLIEEAVLALDAKLSRKLTESSERSYDFQSPGSSELLALLYSDDPAKLEEAVRCSAATSLADMVDLNEDYDEEI